jgi:Uma2 family endonuclease
LLGGFVKQRRLGVVTGAETGFLLSRDPDTVRAPDVAFVAQHRVPAEEPVGFFLGAPDLAVEVLSPSDRQGEVQQKVKHWLQAGSGEVWVVQPDQRSVSIYASDGSSATFTGADLLASRLWPALEVRASELFE